MKYFILSDTFRILSDDDFSRPSLPKTIQNLHLTELTSLVVASLDAISRPYSSLCASLKGVVLLLDILKNDD